MCSNFKHVSFYLVHSVIPLFYLFIYLFIFIVARLGLAAWFYSGKHVYIRKVLGTIPQ